MISQSQRQEFPRLIEALKLYSYYEIAAGKCGKELKKLLKPLVKYCPLVENDLMRLGGRLQRSKKLYDMKHPIVLPKKSHLTTLIVLYLHQKSGHNGVPYVINELRERFYFVGLERTVIYLTMLQKRHKWLLPKPNIEPNTLVLVKDENVPRGVLPKGVVVSVSPDRNQVCRSAVV